MYVLSWIVGVVSVCVCYYVCINDLARNRRITGECMADFTSTLS